MVQISCEINLTKRYEEHLGKLNLFSLGATDRRINVITALWSNVFFFAKELKKMFVL
jgi:hypothetical protein